MKINSINVSIEPWALREMKVLRITVRTGGQVHNAEVRFDPSDIHAPIDVMFDEAKEQMLRHLTSLEKTGRLCT